MRTIVSALIAAAFGCSGSGAPEATRGEAGVDTFLSYSTLQSSALQSTLFQHAEREQTVLRGHSQLVGGGWLVEEATLDGEGRLVRAVVDSVSEGSDEQTHMLFDAAQGLVEVSTPTRYTRWNVPTDYPWVPTGQWQVPSGRLATPLALTVALRGVGSDRVVRLVDVEHFTHFTIVADQVLVDDAEPSVVLGDDYADVEDGLPMRVHLAALEASLDARCPGKAVAWARASCRDPRENRTVTF